LCHAHLAKDLHGWAPVAGCRGHSHRRRLRIKYVDSHRGGAAYTQHTYTGVRHDVAQCAAPYSSPATKSSSPTHSRIEGGVCRGVLELEETLVGRGLRTHRRTRRTRGHSACLGGPCTCTGLVPRGLGPARCVVCAGGADELAVAFHGVLGDDPLPWPLASQSESSRVGEGKGRASVCCVLLGVVC